MPPEEKRLAEVWGDVVDERSVKIAVLLGIAVAVPSFLVARAAFGAGVDNQDLARTYAMVVGLAACLVAGGIAAKLFKPQRIVTERGVDPEDQRRVLRELGEAHGIGTLADLSARERDELRRLGLEEVFLDAEKAG
ncbi:hypothetical protein GCM10027445_19380 [Amycolatopsis endophytica]|uniref:Uncharacterized protein n=1 Tax=Amycolatopsis endophytica TaxID=860233 RepID=A0A853BET7_9PSEU|nr:hypothetical protein [Amycolatopsis endophytica]NYI93171.1 hypothetical protein [Amycolatopsis endophytica]